MTARPESILLATGNQGKVKEIQDLLSDSALRVMSLSDISDPPAVVEDGDTFEENARKKARALAEFSGMPTLADDSGLCVDALDGRPGVHSARYAGERSSDEEKYLKLLAEMESVPDEQRTARFVCVLLLAWPDGTENVFRGECEGLITREPHGRSGFGYDPVFYYEPAGCTFAELDRSEKNRVSHRGRALQQFLQFVRST